MKKKILGLLLLAVVVFAMAACGDREETTDTAAGAGASEEAEWVIGILTGTVSQGEEEYLAAARMQELFGNARIVRATYPDAFGAEMETTIAQIQWLVDQGAQALVIVQAVPGTIPAIQLVRETVDENILLFAGTVHDPPRDIAQHADIAVISDDLNVGPLIVRQAHSMGAEIMAHVSFPRHLGMENIAVRRERMMEQAAALGMEWLEITAPDPTTEGVATTQMFILEEIPRIIEEHGDRVAFFSTNCAMQEPLITQIINYGGFYPLQCCPSPFHALPAALNIDMGGREGDVQFVLDQTAAAVAAQGGAGRISTWPVPINMLLIEAGVRYSIEYLEGNLTDRHDRAALNRIFNEVAQGFGGGGVELANWIDDQGTIDNFYLLMSSFVNF